MNFNLTNKDRQYLGLEPIEDHWEVVELTPEINLYFDGDLIKKEIICSDNHYRESKMNELTSDNRTILLPKTKRGKPKKLNFSSFSKRNGTGVYFSFDSSITIANYTTQTTFLSSYGNEEIEDFKALRNWLDTFIQETTDADLQDINSFKTQTRKRVKYKAGDFFRFKRDRRNYGYGRILFDVNKYRKTDEFKSRKNYGLGHLMGKILTIKVYHVFGKKEISINELKELKAFPAQHIMDNHFFYGEYEIIGHSPIQTHEYDFPMSLSQSINSSDRETVYFQWGKLYRDCNISEFDKYIDGYNSQFRNEGTGFGLDVNKQIIKQCIKENSNDFFWKSKHIYSIKDDLRNPKNSKAKEEVFKQFGLDIDKSYVENLNVD